MDEPGGTSAHSRILLVDNEQDILDLLARLLGSVGYNIDMARNGRLALAKVCRRNYDLIISNIRMPVMGGEAFYHQLCASYPHLSGRIIFCTGDIANASTRRFLNATGVPVIFKPFQLHTVLDVVSGRLSEIHSPAKPPGLPLLPPGAITAPAY
jgi:CheY-like chemotaxis protein